MSNQPVQPLEVLAESGRLLTSTLDLGEVLDRLAQIAHTRLDVDAVRIWLLDEAGDTLILRAQTGVLRRDVPAKDRLSPHESVAGWTFTHQTPLVLADWREDPRVKNREWFEAEGFISLLCVPIMLGGSPIGILACMRRSRREFTEADVVLAQALTAPAVAAVRNAALYAEAVARLDELQAFQRVAAETLSSPGVETALRAVVREMQKLVGAEAAACSLVEPETRRLHTFVACGTREEAVSASLPEVGEGLVEMALREKRPMRTDDYLGDPRLSLSPAAQAWARGEGVVSLITAPVLDAAGGIIALLWAFNRTPTRFTPRHEATLASLAQQAALAIGRAQAFEDERRRARETAALLDIARASMSTLELKPLLAEIARHSARAVGAERCAIFLWRGGQLVPAMGQFADGHADPEAWARFKALRDQPLEQVPAYAEAMRLRRPVAATRESGLLPARWFETLGIGSALVVPLVSKDRVVGAMSLDDSRGGTVWEQAQQDLATTIAAQVALAVDTARHYEEARQRASEVEALSTIGETLSSTLDLQKVLEAIADSAITLIGAQRAAVFELDQAARRLRARAVRGVEVDPGLTLRPGQGAVGCAVQRLEPVWSADILADPLPGYDDFHERSGMLLGAMVSKYGLRAVLAVPMISRETALGAVSVQWDQVHRPDDREIRLLSALARHAAIALDNARLVADLRRTLDDLRAAQETLVRGATLRAVGELAGGASHHLNNLMAVVLGRTQLLLLKDPGEAIAKALRSIERAAIEAADTVRRIQAFGRMETGGPAADFDLNAVVQEAIELTRVRWEDEAQMRGIRIEVLSELGVLPPVSGRRAEIREVVTNLILNAVDALPEGGRIVIATQADRGRVIGSVTDSGIGMSDEVKRRAFEPFFTTKGVKQTGLGLAVAYGTIRRHGGQITLQSGEGQGTRVTFWLPAAEGGQAAGRSTAEQSEEPRGRVLVIDDEGAVRELVADALTSEGHTVTVAAGGREGLARFEAGGYDLVITDLGMPDLNGWEVAHAVKAASRDTPVLILTGWDDPVDPSAATQVDGILKKPFDLKRLAAAVSAAIGRGR